MSHRREMTCSQCGAQNIWVHELAPNGTTFVELACGSCEHVDNIVLFKGQSVGPTEPGLLNRSVGVVRDG